MELIFSENAFVGHNLELHKMKNIRIKTETSKGDHSTILPSPEQSLQQLKQFEFDEIELKNYSLS